MSIGIHCYEVVDREEYMDMFECEEGKYQYDNYGCRELIP